MLQTMNKNLKISKTKCDWKKDQNDLKDLVQRKVKLNVTKSIVFYASFF